MNVMLSKGVNTLLELHNTSNLTQPHLIIVNYLIPCTVSICMTAGHKGGMALVHLKMCPRSCILTR